MREKKPKAFPKLVIYNEDLKAHLENSQDGVYSYYLFYKGKEVGYISGSAGHSNEVRFSDSTFGADKTLLKNIAELMQLIFDRTFDC